MIKHDDYRNINIIIPMKFCQNLKYSSSVRCLPEARLVQFRDATISKAEETTVACSLYPLASRKDLTSSSEWIASLKLLIFGEGGSKSTNKFENK